MWEVCSPFPTRCGLHLREEQTNNNSAALFQLRSTAPQALALNELSHHPPRWQRSRDGTGSVRASEAHPSISEKHPLRKQFGFSCTTWTCLAVWPTHHPCSSHTACLINNNSESKNIVTTASRGKGARRDKQYPRQTTRMRTTPRPPHPKHTKPLLKCWEIQNDSIKTISLYWKQGWELLPFSHPNMLGVITAFILHGPITCQTLRSWSIHTYFFNSGRYHYLPDNDKLYRGVTTEEPGFELKAVCDSQGQASCVESQQLIQQKKLMQLFLHKLNSFLKADWNHLSCEFLACSEQNSDGYK